MPSTRSGRQYNHIESSTFYSVRQIFKITYLQRNLFWDCNYSSVGNVRWARDVHIEVGWVCQSRCVCHCWMTECKRGQPQLNSHKTSHATQFKRGQASSQFAQKSAPGSFKLEGKKTHNRLEKSDAEMNPVQESLLEWCTTICCEIVWNASRKNHSVSLWENKSQVIITR